MTRNMPALLVNGKVVTGSNHGDAFGKLPEEDQHDPSLLSGFYDGEAHKFVSEDQTFYLKSILLVRHADAEDDHLTPLGCTQAKRAAAFLLSLHANDYGWFSSPRHRCLETMAVFCGEIAARFEVAAAIRPKDDDEEEDHLRTRLGDLIERLPKKSLLVCHSDVIQTLVLLTTGEAVKKGIPHCSLTLIHDGRAMYLGKGA